ncbi:MAG: serine protein kinase RIO [Candidatus Korarchaeum sp.]|nr:serine protein kinase RIO [Candidatus Korarchaeum sp.]MDW8035339.1 serine protein kinase RIO [Candidatus Korarchaeum sp.]
MNERLEELEERVEEILRRGKEEKRIKDEEYYEVKQLVFDNRTVRNLLKLFNKGILDDLTWIVSSGKESVVLAGRGAGVEVAVKVHRVYTANFKRYLDYIVGDHRFVPVKDKEKLINTWARKEFRNLLRMWESGVNVPKPVDLAGNIVVMEFIGEGSIPAPLLREVEGLKSPREVRDAIIDDVRRCYLNAGLVHGDLSEYNIMYWKGRPWIIDVSQAVVLEHPLSYSLLLRDLERVINFFKRRYGLNSIDARELADGLVRERVLLEGDKGTDT